MTRLLRVTCALALACVICTAAAVPAAATEVTAGWVRSDLGLDQAGDGLFVGVAGTWALGTGPFDVSAGGAFVRKRGVQPLLVANPDLGLVRSDAEVTLTCLQPEASVGWNLPVGRCACAPTPAAPSPSSWTRPGTAPPAPSPVTTPTTTWT